ncbi:MAG TPA: arginine repressor [Clostridiales bacterium]|nr:arginine repressor [Clostridiales bacterium]
MKISRQSKIIELISRYDIETQEELAEYLMKDGYNVTQATVSRDIRELKLTKIALDGARQKYVVLQSSDNNMTDKYTRVLKEAFISMEMAQNIIVLKTVSGMAMAVAVAIDDLNINGVVGCIAGDDTIMCVVRTNDDAIPVMEKIKKLIT